MSNAAWRFVVANEQAKVITANKNGDLDFIGGPEYLHNAVHFGFLCKQLTAFKFAQISEAIARSEISKTV